MQSAGDELASLPTIYSNSLTFAQLQSTRLAIILESVINVGYGDAYVNADIADYNSVLPFKQLITATMNKFTLLFTSLALSTNLAAQTINDQIRNDWPDERYQVHGDGTVTDSVTGLMWMQCSLGQDSDADCAGAASEYNWQEALEATDEHTFAAYSDWRLPNIKELSSLVARDRDSPAINIAIFPNTQSTSYWSASPIVDWPENSWQIRFDYGYDFNNERYYNAYVRLVRSSQS